MFIWSPVLSYLTSSCFCPCPHLPTSRRIPQSIFPQLSSERWAACLRCLSPIVGNPSLQSPSAVVHRHEKEQGETVLSNTDTSRNTSQWCPVMEMSPIPAQGSNHLDPIGQPGVCLGRFTWRCWRDVNLKLPAIKHQIPLMPVDLTIIES